MRNNFILNADSYKASHYLQYPPGTSYVSSYIESRGGRFNQTVFFGLQIFLKEYLMQPVSNDHIDEAAGIFRTHGVPFNESGWRYIVDNYAGFLPVKIHAAAEGSVIPVKNALLQVVNTDPSCAWLTSYIETALLRAVWYPTTVATISWHCRQLIQRYLQETADSTTGLAYKLHDFGARGATSEESAAIGGAAHLVNFQGSDTLSGIMAARRYYAADMPGFSIPAAEHSTITVWGQQHELDAYANMLKQFSGPNKTVAVVSDSYDLWRAIDHLWGGPLKSKIEQSGGTLVVRPDSGYPPAVVTETIDRLMSKFGSRTNIRGYRVLPDYIRVIQGDGVSLESIQDILDAMKNRKQSAENISFGMGGELLQKLNRDTLMFAMKASAACVEGEWRDVYKDPVTDPDKRSKKGRLALIKTDNTRFETARQEQLGNRQDFLSPVFENGQLIREFSFDEVRANAAENIESQHSNPEMTR